MNMKEIFAHRAPNREKLKRYGFEEREGRLVFCRELFEGQFTLTVTIFEGGKVGTEVFDRATEEPYTLHLVEAAQGEFVGRVREEYASALREIAEQCFEREIFQSPVTKALISRVREVYGDEPEYLWEKFPENAVWRRKDNRKWYGAILTAAREKIGMAGGGNAEVLDVRADPSLIPRLLDGETVFPGYHMNKTHWITLPLDGTVPLGRLEEFLEESRRIAKKGKE